VVSNMSYFHPYLGKWSKLTNMFKMGGPTTKQQENKHQKVTKEFYSCLGFACRSCHRSEILWHPQVIFQLWPTFIPKRSLNVGHQQPRNLGHVFTHSPNIQSTGRFIAELPGWTEWLVHIFFFLWLVFFDSWDLDGMVSTMRFCLSYSGKGSW